MVKTHHMRNCGFPQLRDHKNHQHGKHVFIATTTRETTQILFFFRFGTDISLCAICAVEDVCFGRKRVQAPCFPKTSWIWVVLYLESIVTMNVLSSRECYWSNEVGRAPDEIGESTRTTWNLGGRVQNFQTQLGTYILKKTHAFSLCRIIAFNEIRHSDNGYGWIWRFP